MICHLNYRVYILFCIEVIFGVKNSIIYICLNRYILLWFDCRFSVFHFKIRIIGVIWHTFRTLVRWLCLCRWKITFWLLYAIIDLIINLPSLKSENLLIGCYLPPLTLFLPKATLSSFKLFCTSIWEKECLFGCLLSFNFYSLLSEHCIY
jgi:hypothetical protein